MTSLAEASIKTTTRAEYLGPGCGKQQKLRLQHKYSHSDTIISYALQSHLHCGLVQLIKVQASRTAALMRLTSLL